VEPREEEEEEEEDDDDVGVYIGFSCLTTGSNGKLSLTG
jgi:hypothetical protein